MQVSLAGFGSALAGLSLARRGQCPFVPLHCCLAIGRRANNHGWFPPQWPSGTSLPCNRRGWGGGGHNNSDDDDDKDDRQFAP
jgi:hypothetical protein